MLLKGYKGLLRPFDVVLLVVVVLVSLMPWAVFTWHQMGISEAELYAVILINGQEVDRFRLYDGAVGLYTYTSEHGLTGNQYHVVEVKGTYIRVKRDNSPNQIGVNMGWISRPGQTIVVLPHRFLIRVEAVARDEGTIIPF
ncbi:MAG: NusG domain II-containing protein [Defluviitaleaceae bacterium]|nr:NusG domain II-containing protein [Defluviitaleaceae bacterium]